MKKITIKEIEKSRLEADYRAIDLDDGETFELSGAEFEQFEGMADILKHYYTNIPWLYITDMQFFGETKNEAWLEIATYDECNDIHGVFIARAQAEEIEEIENVEEF